MLERHHSQRKSSQFGLYSQERLAWLWPSILEVDGHRKGGVMGIPELSPVDPFDESKGYYSKEEEALVKMPRPELLADLAASRAENEWLRAERDWMEGAALEALSTRRMCEVCQEGKTQERQCKAEN